MSSSTGEGCPPSCKLAVADEDIEEIVCQPISTEACGPSCPEGPEGDPPQAPEASTSGSEEQPVDAAVTEEEASINKAEQLKQEGNHRYALEEYEEAAELYWQVRPAVNLPMRA